jgi:hypothetical protein
LVVGRWPNPSPHRHPESQRFASLAEGSQSAGNRKFFGLKPTTNDRYKEIVQVKASVSVFAKVI